MPKKIILIIAIFFYASLFSAAENTIDLKKSPQKIAEIYFREIPLKNELNFTIGQDFSRDYQAYHFQNLPQSNSHQELRRFAFQAPFKVTLSDEEDPGLFIGPSVYPGKIYLNGTLIFRRGQYLNTYTSILYNSDAILLPRELLQEINLLTIEVYCYSETTPLWDIYWGSFSKLTNMVFLRNLANNYFISGVFVMAFVLWLFYMFSFIYRQGKESKFLYFALTCFFFLFSYSNFIFTHNFSNEVLLEKISRIGFAFTVMSVTLFNIKFTGVFDKNIWIKLAVTLPNILLSAITLFLNSKFAIHFLFNKITAGIIFPVLFFLNLIILGYSFFKNKQKESLYLFLGFLFLIAMSLGDIQALGTETTPYAWLTPYGYSVLVIVLFFILALEQSRIYHTSLIKEEALKENNLYLGSVIEKTHSVSQNLYGSIEKLNTLISQADKVVQNYSEKNSNIVDQVVQQFGHVGQLLTQIKTQIKESSDRIPQAVTKQTQVVESISETIESMNQHMASTLESAHASRHKSQELSNIAQSGNEVITETSHSLQKISAYAMFIEDILKITGDVAEQTGILAINASIEAARAGAAGKGFSIVANEVRKLSTKSQESLQSSGEQINGMKKDIIMSNQLAENVRKSFTSIQQKSIQASEEAGNMTELIENQKDQTNTILNAVNGLLKETFLIRDLTFKDKEQTEIVHNSLSDLQNTFLSITSSLKAQSKEGRNLSSFLKDVRKVLNENLENANILGNLIQEGQVKIDGNRIQMDQHSNSVR
ncbi:MAG: hypothetical protein JXR70_14465 [Spirochaetales bacterium]|nr:hypothetical protein [Spirochaetales bacterium]